MEESCACWACSSEESPTEEQKNSAHLFTKLEAGATAPESGLKRQSKKGTTLCGLPHQYKAGTWGDGAPRYKSLSALQLRDKDGPRGQRVCKDCLNEVSRVAKNYSEETVRKVMW